MMFGGDYNIYVIVFLCDCVFTVEFGRWENAIFI